MKTSELNDAIDACSDHESKRRLFQTFTKEQQDAVVTEHVIRTQDRVAPVGSLVAPLNHERGIWIVSRAYRNDAVLHGTYFDLAIVIGQKERGSIVRYLWLNVPWEDREGTKIHYAEANSNELQVFE